MRGKLLIISIIWMTSSTIFGQSCNCDVTLTGLKSTSLNLIWASQVNYSPGDTICIPAGSYAGFRFYDFEGTATDPVTFINCGGKVEVTEQQYSGFAFKRSKFIRLTGTGDANHNYGIHVLATVNGGSVGVGVEDLSSDIEIDHLEIQNTGFAGIMAKTDPKCSDPNTWRSNGFVLDNLNIHHNYIHDTGAEGIYVGFTGGYKVKSNRKCNGEYVYGHWLENVTIHNNILEDIDWDGIQLNLVRANGIIRDNEISNYGLDNVYAQDFAMSIGGGIYEIYNNFSKNGPAQLGQGYQLISVESGTKVYNNVIIEPSLHGMLIHNRHEFDDPNEGYYIANNTIIEPEKSGIYYNTVITLTEDPAKKYNTQETVPSYFVNNLVVDPGNDYASGNTWKGDQESYFDFNKRITRDSSLTRIYTNIMTRQIDTLGLQDVLNDLYHPTDEYSSLVNVGSDLSSWGILIDINNDSRPSMGAFDVGAFEYQSTTTSLTARIPIANEDYEAISEEETTLFYPNPAYSSFRLENKGFEEEVKLQILSSEGRILYDGVYKTGSPFNIESYKPGLYFLKVFSKGANETHRLVVR
ncbi:T9SS type A sorting domain-containing protein [Spongiimicrobium salis]|uniref:T9SS type A sorting domain-containing protein n=1 Tax=Spongiimicrobium salis TaxID=1667022 RepID=UPI00374D970B